MTSRLQQQKNNRLIHDPDPRPLAKIFEEASKRSQAAPYGRCRCRMMLVFGAEISAVFRWVQSPSSNESLGRREDTMAVRALSRRRQAIAIMAEEVSKSAFPSSPPPFRPLALQPDPKYFQVHLPGLPWYYFHEYMRSYISNRNATESAVIFDLAFEPNGGTLTLGGAEIDHAATDQWTEFPGPGLKGYHNMGSPISTFTYHIGGVNRLPGRRVFVDASYKVAAAATAGTSGSDRLDVTVKIRCLNGVGEADFEGDYSQDYTMADDGSTRAERTFRIVLEGTAQNEWTVIDAEGVEFQDQEVV
ncbi:hypothetical protein V8F06_012301 [Rhypophila decipiens]